MTKATELVPSTDPMVILARMAEKGMGPEQMKNMIDLVKQLKSQQAEAAWNKAMALCQAEIPQVIRSKQGQHSKYAPLEEIDDAIKHIYTNHGFSLLFSEAEGSDPARLHMYCDVRHMLGHTVRVTSTFARDGIGPKGQASGMNATQADGSTWSYCRRYTIYNIFGVVQRGEDRDGNALALETLIEAEQSILRGLITLKKPNLERFWNWVNELHKNPTERIESVDKIVRRHFPVVRQTLNNYKGGTKE